jgi:hypothetical protein
MHDLNIKSLTDDTKRVVLNGVLLLLYTLTRNHGVNKKNSIVVFVPV